MDLLTAKETAKMLGVREEYLAKMRQQNPSWLRFYRLGRRTVRYDLGDVLRKIEACSVGGAPEAESQN